MSVETEENVIISNRLRKIEDILDLKPVDMAELGGCSQATYYRYRKGESVPDSIFLRNIIKNENRISTKWLLMGTGPILSEVDAGQNQSNPKNADQIDFTHLPFYRMKSNESKSEGELPIDKWENPSRTLPFCNIFFNNILQTQSDQLFALRVNCDSMNPEIKPGSIVLVNQNENRPTGDGIFVVRLGDIVQLKILQYLPNNHLHLTTINKKYDPIEIRPDETDEFEILGRVIWVGTPYN